MNDRFDLAWMGWTWPTATFFSAIALLIVAMTVWEVISPSVARTGLLKIPTTRGDRCFISLLGGAFLAMAWIALVGQHYVALGALWLVYAIIAFRWF